MSTSNWLPLNEYSAKYKISLSTLRRRIKSKEVESRFEAGKYWLSDRPTAKHSRVRPEEIELTREHESSDELMAEIKRAYVSVLHEKEEQIMQLKEEIVDLKTLVKVLEGDNERLKQGEYLRPRQHEADDSFC